MMCFYTKLFPVRNSIFSNKQIVFTTGNAVFFSYMADGTMDNGFTEHSGCPVLVGEKKIVTQWMRKGVDKYNTWDQWNTCEYP